jgi:protoheme IX farnesyltransferase
VVGSDLNAAVVTLHYANAMLLVAAAIFTTVAAYVDLRAYRPSGVHRGFARLALGVAVAAFGLILLGTYVRARSAGLVFSDWPLMNGSLIPSFSIPLAAIQFAHRLAALLVFVGVIALVVRAFQRERDRPPVRFMAALAGVLYVVQAMLGAGFVWTKEATFFVVAHELTGSLVWGALVTTVLLAYRLAPKSEPESLRRAVAARRRALVSAGEALGGTGGGTAVDLEDRSDLYGTIHLEGDDTVDVTHPIEHGNGTGNGDGPGGPHDATFSARIQAYVAMTKPHIIILLLITTVPAMVLAQNGWPSAWLILATLFGGTLSAAGANVINCYIDRDIDEVMRRTRRRPIPRAQVSPAAALTLGIGLGTVAFVFLALVVNLLSAVLSTAALLFYVFVYTLWLKRTSSQNIVIGGAAGAAPVLVGWAAVTGRVELPAIVMFLIVFYWTPPHFWALSMRYESDYRAAGVPMLPVVRGTGETTRQILLYSFVLFAITLLLYPVARLGLLYLTAALVLGGIFIYEAVILRREKTVNRALHLFHYSNTYLALLFAAVAADPLVRAIR